MKITLAALSLMLLSTTAVQAQSGVSVEVSDPDAEGVVITTEQSSNGAADNGSSYNNSDMQPLPGNPGVETESVQSAETQPPAAEAEITIEESETISVPQTSGSN